MNIDEEWELCFIKSFIIFEKIIIMKKVLKKYVAKYTLEFFVIVLGISVSFYINEAKKTKERAALSESIRKNILNEIYDIEKYLQEREVVLSDDIVILELILSIGNSTDSLIQVYNSKEENIAAAVFYFRGFKPPVSVYNSLVNDGSLMYIKSLKVKERLDKMHTRDDYNFNQFIASEKVALNKINHHIQTHYPTVYINSASGKKGYLSIQVIKKLVDNDRTLNAFLVEKLLAMNLKSEGMKNYKDSLEKVKGVLLKSEL
jgi:hypothetical protein